MIGLDQIVVCLWFLPVTLFIILPLCIGTAWLPFALVQFIQGETETTLGTYNNTVKVEVAG